ncbi:MAG: hypothetical protein G01um101448_299 [Parcubacteria group bacterium Gr01-1014_48]|nr:MAG: hypothetical protein Greene041614_310 [Parcubacteria group bacterium Greene0416_14]TSC74136.1 MAG: hypothetical protein G01um101448_299 [Parcubacteria group bacterium Gr01-1014_48]TSD01707.1 MAG: hypothetical protein Greene101415_105 [Parcubacteria group bacterium Greene1014_15]TSD08159.1 MAG: hypothetical protein Greene07144_341 [Parcubacteria group bacterium Greene0714_4]
MKTHFFSALITDCRDENARGRELSRLSTFLPAGTAFVGVQSDLEAAGNLIDILDAGGEEEGVVLVNVAPRQGVQEKWENGAPFGYFWHKKTLVIATIEGLTLSLVKKLDLTKNIHVLNVFDVAQIMFKHGMVNREEIVDIGETQFRSFEFLPRAAALLLSEKHLPARDLLIEDVLSAPRAVWWIDNFGNCKTTLLSSDILVDNSRRVALLVGEFPFFDRLRDVPDGERAVIQGSSGISEKRFLEIIIQGKNAASELNISSGMEVL